MLIMTARNDHGEWKYPPRDKIIAESSPIEVLNAEISYWFPFVIATQKWRGLKIWKKKQKIWPKGRTSRKARPAHAKKKAIQTLQESALLMWNMYSAGIVILLLCTRFLNIAAADNSLGFRQHRMLDLAFSQTTLLLEWVFRVRLSVCFDKS